MKRYLTLLPTLLISLGAAQCVYAQDGLAPKVVAKKVVPTTDKTVKVKAETIASCQSATQELGNNVVKGNILFTMDKMYPRYKNRQVKRHGEKNFKQQFLDAAKTLNTMGVTITSFKAEAPVGFFRVWPLIKPDAKLKLARGEQKVLLDSDVVYNLLVMVPTTQVWTFRSNSGGPPRKLKRVGFQIAIAKETAVPGKEEWTFIDGGTIKPQELRAMFPSLPQELVLPERMDSEIK